MRFWEFPESDWVMNRDLYLTCDVYRQIGSDCATGSMIPRRIRPYFSTFVLFFLIFLLVLVVPVWADPVVKGHDIQDQDANADRIGLDSTAEVLPKGTMSFNDYDIILLQYNWGVTKGLELSFSTMIPVNQLVLVSSIKWQVLRSDKARLAFQLYVGGLLSYNHVWGSRLTTYFLCTYIGEPGSPVFVPDPNGGAIVGGGISAMADICIGDHCNSFVSLSGQFGSSKVYSFCESCDQDECSPTYPQYRLYYQVNTDGVFKVSRMVKILAGLSFRGLFANTCKEKDLSHTGLFSLKYGVRIYSGHLAGDLGLIRPIFSVSHGKVQGMAMKYMPVGYPFLEFTYKW